MNFAAVPTRTAYNVPRLAEESTPTPTCCSPDEIIIALSTNILLPHYSAYYKSPIDQWPGPEYNVLMDGSLVASPLARDILLTQSSLLLTGILLALFARNTLVAANYAFRGAVKNKALFYTLLASQILGLFTVAAVIITHFKTQIDCHISVVISNAVSSASVALLITGVLGVKAYRCLDNSRLVLASLALLRSGSIAASVAYFASLNGDRSLAGGCVTTADNITSVRVFIVLQFVESLFVCTCFLYAVRKSRSISARGRISLQPSVEEPPKVQEQRRGWWDYVPKVEQPFVHSAKLAKREDIIHTFRSGITRFFRKKAIPPDALLRKPSLAGEFPISQPSRTPSSPPQHRSPRSLAPSTLSRFMPRMMIFREVMRDEMCYTAFITATCVVVAFLSILGANIRNNVPTTVWLSCNWAVISLVAIHSSGRVVARHERDAMLQHPSNIRPDIFTDITRPVRASTVSYRSTRSLQSRLTVENPFEDPSSRRSSWNSGISGPMMAHSLFRESLPNTDASTLYVLHSPFSEKFPPSPRPDSDIGIHLADNGPYTRG